MLTQGVIENSSQKVTVVLPQDLLARLSELVPTRTRSKFITEAILEKLELLEQAAGIEEGAGLWKDEDYPDLKTPEDIENWLRELRRASSKIEE